MQVRQVARKGLAIGDAWRNTSTLLVVRRTNAQQLRRLCSRPRSGSSEGPVRFGGVWLKLQELEQRRSAGSQVPSDCDAATQSETAFCKLADSNGFSIRRLSSCSRYVLAPDAKAPPVMNMTRRANLG